MTDFPFQRVLEFVRTVVPFDALSTEELTNTVRRMNIAFYPKGEVIIQQGGPPASHLYIIQAGSARVSYASDSPSGTGSPNDDPRPEDILVDVRAEGDTFGAVSMLQGREALFSVTAREDLICYLLPAGPFKELVADHAVFERHFSSSLARNLEAVRKGAAEECGLHPVSGPGGGPIGGLGGGALIATPIRSLVADIMSREVLTCLPATTIKAAAHLMTQRRVGSVVVVEPSGAPLGMLTDTDLRVRVVAQGRSLDQPVLEVVSHPVHTIGPDDYGFEALMSMSRHGTDHLVVTKDDRVVGIISNHDLQTLSGLSPVGLSNDIDNVDSLGELVKLHSKIDRVLEMFLRQGGEARMMLELVTEFNDRLTIKLLELVENEMENQGLGRPPVPYTWMALGSEGRKEQTLRTDQDNAIIFTNVPDLSVDRIQKWFLGFADRVVDGLERCGFPRCKGGVMASNPDWCQSEKNWRRTFHSWIVDPEPRSLRMASIFFDYREIYAEADHLEKLHKSLRAFMEDNRLFLRYLARNSLYNKPPLGFLRQFVVHKDGEHKNKLNLKLSGLTPIVDAARVMALDQGVEATGFRARLHEDSPHGLVTNTLDRLEEVARRGLIKQDMAADLREAFSFITILRITHHLEARARGEMPDNFVDPASLNSLQRKMLKESFGVITKLQELLEHRYQTWLVT
jgi:CBS domain-containing protein